MGIILRMDTYCLMLWESVNLFSAYSPHNIFFN